LFFLITRFTLQDNSSILLAATDACRPKPFHQTFFFFSSLDSHPRRRRLALFFYTARTSFSPPSFVFLSTFSCASKQPFFFPFSDFLSAAGNPFVMSLPSSPCPYYPPLPQVPLNVSLLFGTLLGHFELLSSPPSFILRGLHLWFPPFCTLNQASSPPFVLDLDVMIPSPCRGK